MSAPLLHTCVRNGEIICPDDLCRGVSTTLCGLEEGIDFGVEYGSEFADDPDDYWDDDA